jgi:hypothetical protein
VLPVALANWMNVRKQLGLTAMWIISQHMVMSRLLVSKENYYYPLYMHDASNFAGPAGETDNMMTAYGEAMLLLAVMGYSLFLLVAITSVPSIAAAMSWKEWSPPFPPSVSRPPFPPSQEPSRPACALSFDKRERGQGGACWAGSDAVAGAAGRLCRAKWGTRRWRCRWRT